MQRQEWAFATTLLLLLAGSCLAEEAVQVAKDSGEENLKAYEGCTRGEWGSICIKDNHDGTSTICTVTPYYSGCTTYPNGDLPHIPEDSEQHHEFDFGDDHHKNQVQVDQSRKMLSDKQDFLSEKTNHGRSLKVYEGCSKGFWGSVCTKDNHDGTSTTCTNTKWYNGCHTYKNGSGGGSHGSHGGYGYGGYGGYSGYSSWGGYGYSGYASWGKKK